jgi:hypothetical protein
MTTPDLFGTSDRDAAIDALHAATAIYTSEPVVDDLLDAVDWPRGTRKLIDPSCGDGMFLGRAMARLLRHRPDLDANTLPNLLEGWELHPGAAQQARGRLATILVQHGWDKAHSTMTSNRLVRQADFLTQGPTAPCCHVIAGNPPYLRFVSVPPVLRAEYTAALPQYACADLLHSFLDRCTAVLHDDGEIALVTADRWLFNAQAAKLRAAVGSKLAIDHLERLDPATAFYRPKHRRAGTPPRVHPVAVVLRRPSASSIRLNADPVFPDRLRRESAPHQTLGDIARVSLAPWLGTHGIFVVDRETAASLPQDHLVPAIDTDDIRDGKLGPPTRYAIRTHPDSPPPPAILAHLAANMHRMAARGRRKIPWLPPESWHQRQLDQPFLLVPRIARSLRPVRVAGHVLPINHNLSIVTAGDRATLDEIEDRLHSAEANAWMRDHAARLDGDFFSLTTTLLRQMPVG